MSATKRSISVEVPIAEIRAHWLRTVEHQACAMPQGERVEATIAGPLRDLYVASWHLLARLDDAKAGDELRREIAALRRAVLAVHAADPDGVGR